MILDWLLQPFSYAFMQRGLVAAQSHLGASLAQVAGRSTR